MKLTDLVSGEWGHIFSNTIILVILLLMFVISLRLFLNRRKKGYFSMTVSLIILIIQYILMLYFDVNHIDNSTTSYLTLMFKIVSFILVNMGIYQLYNPTRRKHYLFFYSLILLSFFISLLHFYSPEIFFHGAADQVQLLQDIGLDLYLFVLMFLFSYMVAPFIGQQGKYQTALTLYFTNQIAHLLNVYIFNKTQVFLSLIENIVPIGFYFMLFLILFERVVELMQAIYNSSIRDGLTLLYNRKFFYNRVSQYIQRHLPVSIVFSDIDNFKKLNDTKGHQMGDQVLKQVAEIMKQACEDCGIVGRYGGEEIVILVTDPSVQVGDLAEKIRKQIEEETIVTVSMGCSKYKSGLNAELLIKQADEAMYKAKTTGKNKVVKYG